MTVVEPATIGFDEGAALRATSLYALRLGLYANTPEVEDLVMAAILKLSEAFGFPTTTHDGWTIGTRPIPTPPGETAVRFTLPAGGGF